MPKSKLEKQNEAATRVAERNKRGHKGQISHLDSLFGPGQGAAKERARLKALMEAKPKKESETEGEPKKARKPKSAKA